MDCSGVLRKYSRYLLIIFNLLFVITGVVIVSVGASVKAYYHEYDSFLDDKYIYASDFLIVIGAVIFIIAFFGCWGAQRENSCMTLTFSTLLIVILVLEIIVGICGFVLRHKTEDLLDALLTKTMKEYKNNTEITDLWDQMQENFQCCGVKNATDWMNVTSTNGQIPTVCCRSPAGHTGNLTCDYSSKLVYPAGCLTAFGSYIESHAKTIGSVGLTLAIIQLLGIILSCYLSKQIRSDYETV